RRGYAPALPEGGLEPRPRRARSHRLELRQGLRRRQRDAERDRRGAGLRRQRLRARVPRREADAGREGAPDLRGNEPDPAHRDRPAAPQRMMDSPPSSELRRSPPSLRGAQILRALPTLVRDPAAFLASARAIHGDVYTVDLGVGRALLLNQPRHAQHVLVDKAENYKKAGPLLSSLRALAGNGLWV